MHEADFLTYAKTIVCSVDFCGVVKKITFNDSLSVCKLPTSPVCFQVLNNNNVWSLPTFTNKSVTSCDNTKTKSFNMQYFPPKKNPTYKKVKKKNNTHI